MWQKVDTACKKDNTVTMINAMVNVLSAGLGPTVGQMWPAGSYWPPYPSHFHNQYIDWNSIFIKKYRAFY